MIYQLSNSQIEGLDSIYEKYFGEKTGTFVEVGAYDGVTHSNTDWLSYIGWNGYYIEPVLEYYKKCKDNYKGCHNIVVDNLAISDIESFEKLYVSGELTTIGNSNSELLGKVGLFDYKVEKTLDVKTTTLSSYIEDKKIESIDLLVIDVEGLEYKVLKGFDFKIKPKMVIIELHELSDYWTRYTEVKYTIDMCYKKLLAQGYSPIFKDTINTIFIHEE